MENSSAAQLTIRDVDGMAPHVKEPRVSFTELARPISVHTVHDALSAAGCVARDLDLDIREDLHTDSRRTRISCRAHCSPPANSIACDGEPSE
jgi:hypothetical protein